MGDHAMTHAATHKVCQGFFYSFAIPKQSPLCGGVAPRPLGAGHKFRTRYAAIAALTLSTAQLATVTTFLAQPLQAHEATSHIAAPLTPEHIAELHSGEILITEDSRQFTLVAPLSELWELTATGEIIAQHSYAFDGSDFMLFFENGQELQLAASEPAPLGAMLAGEIHDLAHFYGTFAARAFTPSAPDALNQSMLFATGPGFAEQPNEYTRHWDAVGAFINVQLEDGSISRFHWTELDKYLTSLTDRSAHD